MEIIAFDKLLLKTAFSCMASDGHIDNREIEIIKELCNKSNHFNDFDFTKEIGNLAEEINLDPQVFISNFLNALEKTNLKTEEELTILEFSFETIKADEKIEYSEIKFFKKIRNYLSLSNELIIENFPEIEPLLQEDIEKENIDKIDKFMSSNHEFSEFNQIDFSILKNE